MSRGKLISAHNGKTIENIGVMDVGRDNWLNEINIYFTDGTAIVITADDYHMEIEPVELWPKGEQHERL